MVMAAIMSSYGRARKAKKPKLTEQEKREKAEKLLAHQEKFKAAAEAERQRVKDMSKKDRDAMYKLRGEKAHEKMKILQGDLIFPVVRFKHKLRAANGLKRTGKAKRTANFKIKPESAIFTSAVLEYITAEVLELAGDVVKQQKKSRISPRHLLAAMKMDEEMSELLPKGAALKSAGVMPKRIPDFLRKTNVPKKDWTYNHGNHIFQEQHIVSKPAAPPPLSSPETEMFVPSSLEMNNNKLPRN